MSKVTENILSILDAEIGENARSLGVAGYLNTGIAELNESVNGSIDGGFPMGRLIEIFGPASCGKTFLATMMMKSAQEAGGIAGFSDHERSFEPVLARSLGLDLDPSKFRYVRPQTFEESIEIAVKFCEVVRKNKLIPKEAPLIWVFDSVASMVPHSKLFDSDGSRRDIGSYKMNDKLALAMSCSQSYPVLAQFCEDNNMMALLLNQTRLKPGLVFGDPTTTPGGQAAEFYTSVRLSIGRKMIYAGTGPNKDAVGFEITSKAVKNKVARPFKTAKWNVIFNDGLGVQIDQVATNLDFADKLGLLKKSGKRYIWEDGSPIYLKALIKKLKKEDNGLEKIMKLIRDSKVKS